MYNKAMVAERQFEPNMAENLADLLFEIGKELYERKQYELAVKWLQRAHDIIESQELDRLSIDATELRTSIIQRSIKALLAVHRDDALDKARDLTNRLESEVGDKFIVLLLKLEILSVSSDSFDGSAYATVMQRIIRTVLLNGSNFKLIMHHIRKLNDKSPSLACNILDEFLQSRIFQSENKEWVESVLVNRIWLATGQRDGPDVLSSVQNVLECVASNTGSKISSSATHAAQMLLWKRIESNTCQGQHDLAESWCRLSLHCVFENMGDINKAKISRKLLLCALARQDTVSAREVFSTMSEAAKNDPMTRFLMFKIAIRSRETELASECLERLSISSEKDAKLLYACVMDAQEVGDKAMAVEALELVLERCEHTILSEIHLPALLRVTIRLVKSQLEVKEAGSNVVEDHGVLSLCKLFEAGKLTPFACVSKMLTYPW
jgi:tetratricopeptide (TPR) repeat protein